MYIVYEHIFPNGKRYIGQTRQGAEGRFRGGYGYKEQLVYRAIEKYGWENVIHKIIMDCLTFEEANIAEQFWIWWYNTTNPMFGYNIAKGGQCGCTWNVSDHQKNLASNEMKNQWKNNRDFWMEAIKRGAQKRVGSVVSEKAKYNRMLKNTQRYCVSQFSLDGEYIRDWESMSQVERELGISNVKKCINGKRKTAGGFVWKRCEFMLVTQENLEA